MTRTNLVKAGLAVLAALPLALASCMRGGVSHDPPVHLVLDMDFQPKLRTQAKVDFEGWADGRAMRLPVNDPVSTDPLGKTLVVARGSLPDQALSHKDASGAFVKSNPLPLTHKFTVLGRDVATIERGRERFEIHCAICHGYSGQGGNGPQGHGLVGRRWPVLVPNLHFVEGKDNRVANLGDGELFDVITYGKNTMPAYGARLSVEDRWAIVHYVRALQSLSK
jgi:mono/diheme cytochrome c family protein